MTDTRTILQPGDVLAGYRIADVIGIGGMAVVYRAQQISLERLVALKVLSAELTSDETFRERFRREGRLAASLEHPNIVPVYDSGEDSGRLYIAMRLIEGGTLADRMRAGSLTPAQALDLLVPVASALDVAHDAGLIHRDVKPANVLIARDGHPYLADFGVARGGHGDGLTSTGSFIGSINYASPEQIRGEPLTAASDIYSFTAVAFQCLTGQVPYPRETDAGVMHAHLTEPPPEVPDDHLPSAVALQEIIARGMAKQPAERFTAAGALVKALRAALDELPEQRHSAPAAFEGIVRAPASVSGRRPEPEPSPRSAPEPERDSGTVAEAPRVEAAHPTAKPPVSRAARGERTAARRRSLTPRALVGSALAVAVALPLLALALSGGDDAPASASAAAGALELSYGQPWQPVRDDPALLPGLELERPQSLSTTGTASEITTLRAGRIADPPARLGGLPAAASRSLGDKPATRQVQVAGVPMVERVARTEDGRALAVYVIETEKSRYAVACSAAGAPGLQQCRDVAAGVELHGERAIVPGPDPKLAAALAGALAPVKSAHSKAALSGTLAKRADSAKDVAAADRNAVSELERADPRIPERAAVRELRRALAAEAEALERLASSATKRKRSSYQSARDALRRAETRLAVALADLERLGYRVKDGA